MHLTNRLVEAVVRLLLRLAPAAYRLAWADDVVTTLRDSCDDARRRAGWRGLVLAGMREIAGVGAAVLRVRAGRRAALTAGGAGSPGDPRRGRRGGWSRLRNDLRLALRSLNAGRVVTAVAVLTLALGVGVNGAVFSILDSTLLRPLAVADEHRYVEILQVGPGGAVASSRSGAAALLEWRRQTDLFERVEGYDITTLVHASDRGAAMLTAASVTPGVMSLFGVRPLAGRLLADGDGRAGAPDVVVIGERFWREATGADPQAVGRSLTLGDRPYQIVGIAPASFRFPSGPPAAWLPVDPERAAAAGRSLTMFARLAPGQQMASAAALVAERSPVVGRAAGLPAAGSARLHQRFGVVDDRLERSLGVLGGAVGFLLLIVCANLANLSLSRALTRSRDVAVRASLGATRADLIRESLVEHLLIGAAGAVAGVVVARVVVDLTLSLLPEAVLVRSMNAIDLDARTLVFMALAGLLAAVTFGLPAALLASRPRLAGALKQQSRAITGSAAARRFRGLMVVSEVAIAIVLLVGATLMLRSVVKLMHVDRGFDTTGLVTLRLGLPANGFADPYARDAFTAAMIERVRRIPGVRAATAGAVPPEVSLITTSAIEFDRAPGRPTAPLVLPVYQAWPGYFDAIGIPMWAGRQFVDQDPREAVIVSETFAQQHFGSPLQAVGQRFRFGSGAWRTIVGVAGEVRQGDLDDATSSFELYVPLKRPAGLPAPAPAGTSGTMAEYRTIVARAHHAATAAAAMRAAVPDVDPRVVVWQAAPLEQDFADAIARPRLVLLLMAVFATMGLVLAAAGIYGALSYLVAQRRREIGIRLALGAVPRSVGGLVLRSGLVLTGAGVAIGVAAALALVRVMQTLLYEVEPSDPLSIVAVVGVIMTTGFAASWWPARRAMRFDPLMLLRED